jgi:CubicO group peptidase (beta-lactamase class C family)
MSPRPCSIALTTLLLAHAGASDYPGPHWAAVDPAAVGLDSALLDAAARRFGEVCGRDGHAQIVVVRGGHVAWQGEEADLVHPVWSCTKSFLSTCLGLLWDDGRCSPETRAAEIMPELATAYPELSLGHLASFTGGFASVPGPSLAPASPLHPPGAAMHYGEQSDLLALLLTRVAGEPLRELFMRRIGRPIGIDDEALVWGRQELPEESVAVQGGTGRPSGGISTSALAFARFGLLYARGGIWNGEQLISRRYLDEATTVRVPATTPPHDPKGWYSCLPGRYGLNWWVNGRDASGTLVWPSLPEGCFAAQGNRNNICVIIPDWDLVIVREGLDPAVDAARYDQAFALLREALVQGGGLSD